MTAVAPPLDPDAARLAELGYSQELSRRLRVFGNASMGFAAISPVVGLYAVVLVGTLVAGPAWVWVLPVALAGQCLLLAVYAELASEFPIAGGAYQWSRRLLGGSYGWMSGWVAICAYAVANTTIAYLGAPWALTLLGIQVTPNAIVAMGMVLVVVCAAVGALGIDVLGRAIKAGILAEAVASVAIGLALLLAFREQDFSIFTHTLGAEALSGGSVGAGMLAALAVAGWVFIGFDACVGASEETKGAARHVPRAIWIALLSVGALVILNAVAVTLAHPDPAAVVAGPRLRSGVDCGGRVLRLVVGQAVRGRRALRVPCLRDGGAGADGASHLLDRPRRRAARLGLPPPGRPAPVADRGDPRHHGDRLPRPAARPEHGRGRQPDRLRHGRDLRRLPARRARGADRPPARNVGPVRACPTRPRGPRDQRARRRLAHVRDRQHRLAAHVTGAAGRTRVPGLGRPDRARRDRQSSA